MDKKEDILLKKFGIFLNALNQEESNAEASMKQRRETFLETFLEENKKDCKEDEPRR